MRILPADLTEGWLVRLLLARDGRPGAPPPAPRLGFWGEWWAEGSGLDRKTAAAAMSALHQQLANAVAIILLGVVPASVLMLALTGHDFGPAIGLPLAVGTGLVLSMATIVPWNRALFRRLVARPIATQEVERLLDQTEEELPRRFLELLRDAVRSPARPETEEGVRTALRALGDAIERLPPVSAETLDLAALRAEADRLRHQACAATDRVIGESLERRAQALLHRAAAHEQSALVVERTQVLRQEIGAQIDALRAGLVALQSDSHDAGALSALASSARTVATEAIHLASAREELEASVGTLRPPTGAPPVEPAVLQARQG